MAIENIQSILTENYFFKDFTPSEIELLVKHAKFKTFNEGEFLFSTGQEAKSFYLVISGTVSLQVSSHEHGIIELDSVQDSEFIGWSWLKSPFIYKFDAINFVKTKTLKFDAKELKKEMDINHEFGFKMYKLFTLILIERLQAAKENIIDIYENNF
jgi:CRP/FNR family cyclic AMP-dependent transcriptional regulator